MTRPRELKPREDEQPGTLFSEFQVAATLPEQRFTITPEIVSEYVRAVDGEPGWYQLDGRPVALPSVLAVYLTAVLYKRYPPLQGGVLIAQRFNFHSPIWADETTHVIANGRVEDKYEKRGRRFIRWSAGFWRTGGRQLATAVNTVSFPG